MKIKNLPLRYKVSAILLAVLILLHFLLRESLPQYSARIPLLAILLLVEYLIFGFIKIRKKPLKQGYAIALRILWWLPVVLLIVFLFVASILPLQEWNTIWRIYLPGLTIMALIAKVIMFIALFPALILQLLGILFIKDRKTSDPLYTTVKTLKGMGIIIGSLAFFGLFIGSIHWVSKFKTRQVNVQIHDLPDNMQGLKIVQLSDIHLGSWPTTKAMQKAVDIVKDIKPDMVVFTGDMVNYSAKETIGFETVLNQIKAPLGVYAILGNHDYGDYVPWPDSISKANDVKLLESFYSKIGWKLLRNESTVIDINGSTILLSGVENWSATSRFHRYGDMTLTMENAPSTDVSILLSHDPTHWEAEVTTKYPRFDLTLSGHTHGMQMGFQGFGIKWSPSQYIYKYWGGMYQNEDKNHNVSRLYVNLGLGHIAYPGRVGILPEITVITLTK